MCLSIPGQIINRTSAGFTIEYPELKVKIKNSLIKKLKVGDWVVVQQKYITQKLTNKQAKEINSLIQI